MPTAFWSGGGKCRQADVDGEGIADLLYAVQTGQGDEQALGVAFGRTAAMPTAATMFGALPPIVALQSRRLVRQDAAHDTLFVVRSQGVLQAALCWGQPTGEACPVFF